MNNTNDFDRYQQFVAGLLMPVPPEQQLAMSALGLAGETAEAGELVLAVEPALKSMFADLMGAACRVAEWVKKNVFHKKEVPRDKIVKALGDCCYYIAAVAHLFDINLSEVFATNEAKLKKRYPNGYNRADDHGRKE